MGLVKELEEPILALLADDDHMVRAAAAEALPDCQSMPTWTGLTPCSTRRILQEAAEQSLDE